jgi:hypothetical protein
MARPADAESRLKAGGNDDGSTVSGYADEDRPLAGHAALSATFLAGFAGALVAARRAGRELPDQLGPWDVALAGVATHKVARLITKDRVTSFLRAPFVRYEEGAGKGELNERPRGRGLQLAIGELLACPYCVGQWVSGAYGVGLVASPRTTRLVGFVFAAEAVADFLQIAYRAAEERAEPS